METTKEDKRCLGIHCKWYNPLEAECTADYWTWNQCKLGEQNSKSISSIVPLEV